MGIRLLDWTMRPDPDRRGHDLGWHRRPAPGAVPAPVPGIIQQVVPDAQGVAWYWTTVIRPTVPEDRRLHLMFGAVDYRVDVWVDGQEVGGHEGVDTPFHLDLTNVARASCRAELTIAVRVVHGTDERIDGLILDEIPHRNKRHAGYQPGWLHNVGGLMGPVVLASVPAVRITDVVVRPSLEDGTVSVTVVAESDLDNLATAEVDALIAPPGGGPLEDGATSTIEVAPHSAATAAITLRVADVRPWNLDDPALYRVGASMKAGHQHRSAIPDQRSVRVGFRDFRVVDGWYRLNGRRILVRSSHTGNHVPIGQTVPTVPDHTRRDLLMAKAAGFTMLRFMAGLPWPEQLDLADEIGLLIYEEPMSAWLLRDSPHMKERSDAALEAMIRRDRNHPSVVIWGLLTEAPDGPVFRHATTRLPMIRELDPTRLVILNSGRFDGQSSIGSVANPGEVVWQPVWGRERANGENRRLVPDPVSGHLTPDAWIGGDLSLLGAIDGNGDTHTYPLVPHRDSAIDFLRGLGRDTQPHMLSEYGIGSLMDVIGETRAFEGAGARPDLLDAALLRSMSDRFAADLDRFGFRDLVPFPRDLLIEAQQHHAAHRALGFDAVRSNPRIAGFNVTGLLDHALTGEGFWSFWRRWKPGIVDVLQDGWAPVRWCLFPRPSHVEAGAALRLEAVLATDDALPAGDYPVELRLHGPDGPAWSRTATVTIPDEPNPPLAIPVLDITVSAPVVPGRYTLAAELLRGGFAAAGRATVHVAAPHEPLAPGTVVGAWGLPGSAIGWLRERGATVDTSDPLAGPVVVVGRPADASSERAWDRLWGAVRAGATAILLEPAILDNGERSLGRLPFDHDARVVSLHDWVYHREWVGGRHPLLAGLPDRGVLRWDRWGPLLGGPMIEGAIPDATVAIAAFAVGYSTPGGYASGMVLASVACGAGKIVLSTLRIVDELSTHPIAGQLLMAAIAGSSPILDPPEAPSTASGWAGSVGGRLIGIVGHSQGPGHLERIPETPDHEDEAPTIVDPST